MMAMSPLAMVPKARRLPWLAARLTDDADIRGALTAAITASI